RPHLRRAVARRLFGVEQCNGHAAQRQRWQFACISGSVMHESIERATTNPENLLLGRSPAILRAIQQIRDAAAVDVAVLISGESGTGKELAARMLHQLSRRARFPMVKVNCPAIPSQLFESELFGH